MILNCSYDIKAAKLRSSGGRSFQRRSAVMDMACSDE